MICQIGGFLRQLLSPTWNPDHPRPDFAAQLRLYQSREHVRAWKNCYPASPGQDIVEQTLLTIGLDVSAALSDPGDPGTEIVSSFLKGLAEHGRVTCAIAIVRTFFYGHVRGAESVLAKCLQGWKDFDTFRLCQPSLSKS